MSSVTVTLTEPHASYIKTLVYSDLKMRRDAYTHAKSHGTRDYDDGLIDYAKEIIFAIDTGYLIENDTG